MVLELKQRMLLLRSDRDTRGNLFKAVQKLADSEIELLKTIENSRSRQNCKKTKTVISKNMSSKKPGKPSNSRPSAALIAAKKKAAEKNLAKKNSNTFVRDIYEKAIESQESIRKDTGLVFDKSMSEHECLWDPNYPECPERFTRVLERCEQLGLVKRCKWIEPRIAETHEILLKHTQEQLDTLKSTDGCKDLEKLEKLSSKSDAIYIHPSTYKLSLLACGSTINLVESICKGEVQNGMAIIRPPGHHAMKSEYCGYCFFNNVAIAAESALRKGLANRILIVDWDVHHGQATQQMFYDDQRVVYFSIHRYENGEFWPNLKESNFNYVGGNFGEGYNFNVPLNKIGMTNSDYLAIFQQVLLPMAYEFQPELIIVSAGYDAALGCPEGQMEVTPACYPHLLSSLMSLAAGKVAVVLEGGYCLQSLAEGAALTLRCLLGDPCPLLQSLDPPSESIRSTILDVIYAHKPYWNCYQYQETYSIKNPSNLEPNVNRHMPLVVYNGDETKPDFYETRDCYPKQSTEFLVEIEKRLNFLTQITNLSKAPNRVCIAYDERMLKHCNLSDGCHPEKPDRVSEIFKKHDEYGLTKRCHLLQGRLATEEELLLGHTREYLESIKNTQSTKVRDLVKQAKDMNSVYLHPDTWTSACVSAGALLQVVDSVLNGDSQSGVAIVRPPGHHAEEDNACGFCIFNNVAIAAKYAVQFHQLKRVLIVDWDIHHGNGTQLILEEDPNVLYISLHRYENGSFFPNSRKGNYNVVGSGRGEGFNVNIPWNKKGLGDAEYLAAFQQIVMPIAYEFNPELVLVSAGFDACIGDPLGGFNVSPELYGHLTHWLSSLANGRIILSLEGGYNVNSISYAMTMCTKALLGDPLPMLEPGRVPCTSAVNSINHVLKTHAQYWSNLKFQVALPKENVLPKTPKTSNKNSNDAEVKRKTSESKIAFEDIESEKLKLDLAFDKSRLSNVTDEEIVKLQNEVENMKIKSLENLPENPSKSSVRASGSGEGEKCAKECVNPDKKSVPESFGGPSGSGSSRSDDNSSAAQATGSNTLSDFLSENFQALVDGEMFAVVPLRDCPHLDSVQQVPSNGIEVRDPCQECQSTAENWICLQCYSVHCARNVNQHAMEHNVSTEHPLALSFSDLSVWCYGCEAYIDNPRLYEARNAAHRSKFNENLPWTYDSPRPTLSIE